MMNKLIVAFLCISIFSACNDKNHYKLSKYQRDYDALLDTLMPFMSGMYDSSVAFQQLSPEKMMLHKVEREYEWMHYAEKGPYSYFMVSRLEPSIKKDKYAGICGRFKRDPKGQVDLSSYEELFWTWKMKKDSLVPKAEILFATVVEKGKIDAYTPEKSKGFWIEFPNANVSYDTSSKSWKTKPSY
jgi:hypothetical protein